MKATAPSTSQQGHTVRESSPATSADAQLRDSFPDSRPTLVRTQLFAGNPDLTFDWRIQEQRPLPPPDFVALQYYNKREKLRPFPCANDFESWAEHQKALLSYCQKQLSELSDPRDILNSYLRGTVLLHLRDEILATFHFLKKVLHKNHRPFRPGVQQELETLCKELTEKYESLRVKAKDIFDRTSPPYNQIFLSPSAISTEKDAICGAVRVIWEVEHHIREYLQPIIQQHQVQQYGPALQVHCDIVSNDRAKREHLKLNPDADLGPQ